MRTRGEGVCGQALSVEQPVEDLFGYAQITAKQRKEGDESHLVLWITEYLGLADYWADKLEP
ncbi:hypothetical protein RvY_00125 [Ramazzottius varieornatus]|uniref:Uncharacterized protein n=1 Tax=Ramazzottius varieornatus TaxID=947166 RepID=A0A1D1ULM3_RAMVA|nr:hypothetical protein RvY_00125 [Ramazzottius varieornatus]